MKLALDGYVLRFPRTGIVNYGFAIAQWYLERLGRENFRILVGDRNVTADEIRTFLDAGDVVPIFEDHRSTLLERIRQKFSGNAFLKYMPGLGSAVNDATRGCDVYHCTDWFFEPSRHAKINAITMFDLTTTLFPQYHEELNITKERMKLRRAADYDFVFCISSATRDDLLRHSAVKPERAIVNYIDTDPIFNQFPYVSRDDLLKKFKVPDGHRYILSVSTIEPRKNFIGVLEAFKRFLEINPDAPYVLLCVGMWGWCNDDLNEYLRQYEFADRLIFTGFVDLEDLPSLYHHADCFMYLSFYEGFGLPILEAMKSHCPVICSNTSSMPEVVGDAGIQVTPDDAQETAEAIASIVSSPAKAEEMRSAGFARSAKFSWNNHVDVLMQTYENAL
ncbi:glycosyltransferase family 1 protein [uncultured Pseudodesulfovibrio sp.]|uniref:glycosyltransferase family 4 protein n=1 Tax=uncultured Pseudodesulfovibrio sp. TaxID=2035858 RepID=UPI0029C74BB8|nr:glycosyltransferase family 1 protein [uncultured Pseudodesulfovibrio sp.]